MNNPRKQLSMQELHEALDRCEEERAYAQSANIAKTDFLAHMSHEIRTPMNAVIGIAHILSASTPLTERQRHCIETLKTSADSLMALITDMLDIAKIESRNLELESIPFDLVKLIQEVMSVMAVKAAEKNIALNFDERGLAHRMFVGDPTRIRQILLNLCSNALKFTERGSIDFIVQCALYNPRSHKISVSVRDTGIGIAADKVQSIFEKFVQADSTVSRKYGGSGLGLTITKMLTEAMGGDICVTSEPGKGSEFTVTFYLPLSDAA